MPAVWRQQVRTVLSAAGLLELATPARPLVIFLDSLDQLPGDEGAHQLAWLPTTLPPACSLVLSTLPSHARILDTFRRLVAPPDNCVEVTPLGHNLSTAIIQSWLSSARRTVTEAQWQVCRGIGPKHGDN